jgi:single-strand DNA-binding protein
MLNKVLLIGNVGKQPEVRVTQKGTNMVKFSVATSEKYKKDGQYQTITEWHNIIVYGKLCEFVAQYVGKGSKIWLEGKINTTSYDKDGQRKYVTNIIASNIQILSDKKEDKQDDLNQDFNNDDIVF